MRSQYRIAVIPDLHMREALFLRAQELDREGYPLTFLGDYVDNGPRANDPVFLREVFAFAREKHAVLLLGNHDLAYVFPEQTRFRLDGYEAESAAKIAQVYHDYADCLRFAHLLDRYLFTHAGVSGPLVRLLAAKYNILGPQAIVQHLNEVQPPELFYRSPHNGGTDPFDGPMWLRLPQYRGTLRSKGITQVVGHSSQARIRIKENLLMVDVGLPLVLEWEGKP